MYYFLYENHVIKRLLIVQYKGPILDWKNVFKLNKDK